MSATVEPLGARHDVIVVGAGVVGLACAYALLKAGRQVTVLDRGRIGGATSHGNCGTITPSHAAPLPMPGLPLQVLKWMAQGDAPLYLKPRWDPVLFGWLLRSLRRCNREDFERSSAVRAELLLASRRLLAEWIERERLDCGFESNGTLYVFRDAGEFEAFAWHEAVLQRVGIAVERKDAAQLQAAEPALNDSVVAGYFHPQDAHLRPDRLAAELARTVRVGGGRILEHCDVSALAQSGDEITGVIAEGRVVAAEAVVLAAGCWTPALARATGLRLPIQPGKGYSITYDRPAIAPKIPLVLKERSVCVTAWADGFRLGSTMEFAGFDDTLNPLRLDALRRGAREYLREPEGPVERERWYGWRPMTPDDLPIVGAAPQRRHLWLATGHGMLGVTLAAVTGEAIAALVVGRTPDVNVRPLSPARLG